MTTRRTVLASVLASLLLIAAAPRVLAQQSAAPVLYRLESVSAFSRGCFRPCECPIFTTEDIRGTYSLAFDHQDPLFTWYKVENVNWVVTLNGEDTRITGSGVYRVGGEVAVQQQMSLKLNVGAEATQTFDSGLVSGGGEFPAIVITISVNGMVCFDTAIDVVSKPVPASELLTYGLKDSKYDEGCFPPCTCLLREWPIQGTCALVPLNNATTPIREEWAIVNVNWQTLSLSPIITPPDRRFTGFGTYQIVQVGPTARQRMVLDLTETNRGSTDRFDSGAIQGGTEFPDIDIDLSVHGFSCFDKAFSLHLRQGQAGVRGWGRPSVPTSRPTPR